MGFRPFLLLFLACLGATACADRESTGVDVPVTPDEVAVFGSRVAEVRVGKTDLTDFAQGGMAERGWSLPIEGEVRPDWVWSNAPESVVWIAGPREGGEAALLELEVRAPDFVAAQFSVHVALNGVDLGSRAIDPDTESIALELPFGFDVLPMNRLVLAGSHWKSPLELGVGDEPRRLSFSFRSARLGEPGDELSIRRITPPHGAILEGAGDVQVIDLETLAPVESVTLADGRRAIRPSEVGGAVALIVPRSQDVSAVRLTAAPGFQSVVVIAIDTLRSDALDLVPTPNIDRLRQGGVVFASAFANAPMTLPSHTALFSGRLPSTSGVVNNGHVVPQALALFPEQLGAEGYNTLGVVSIETLWQGAPMTGLDRGFESYSRVRDRLPTGDESAALLGEIIRGGQLDQPFVLFAHFSDPHDPYRSHSGIAHPLTLELDGMPLADVEPRIAEEVSLQLELAAGTHSLKWASENDRVAPLAVDLASGGESLTAEFVHGGIRQFQKRTRVDFIVPEAGTVSLDLWLSDYPEGEDRILRYAGEVIAVDRAVGQLLNDLDAAGVLDSSLIVFTADHGEAFSEHGYNGHVEHLYDEMLRVPLIIRPPTDAAWDGVRAALAARSESVVSLVDLAPTILELLGRAPWPGTEGVSLLAPMAESPAVRAETHEPEATRDLYSIRSDRWKLIYAPDSFSFELYDVQSDPQELTNLFDEQEASFEAWQRELRQRATRWALGPQPEPDPSMSADLGALGY